MDFKPFGNIKDKSLPFVFFGIASLPWLKGLAKPTAPAMALGIALSLSSASAARAYTNIVSFTYDGNSYAAYNNSSPITWSEARAYALSVGGDLVSLDTPAENGAVFAQIQYTIFPNLWTSVPGSLSIGPYIGLFQPNASDVQTGWQWVDGSLLTSASWYSGQPDNGYGVENIAAYFNQVGQWADIYDCPTTSIPCSANNTPPNDYLSKSFVVEFNPVPSPAPIFGGMAALGWTRRLRRRFNQVNL